MFGVSPVRVDLYTQTPATQIQQTVTQARQIADRAQQEANQADLTANQALQAANEAGQAASQALQIANRIQQQEANQALQAANEAAQAADEALQIAYRTQEEANQALQAANEAEQAADEALQTAYRTQEEASQARQTAYRTQEEASQARQTANQVLLQQNLTANQARRTADEAIQAADEAQEAANQIDIAANQALQAADEAIQAANEAQQAAGEAQRAADQPQPVPAIVQRAAARVERAAARVQQLTQPQPAVQVEKNITKENRDIIPRFPPLKWELSPKQWSPTALSWNPCKIFRKPLPFGRGKSKISFNVHVHCSVAEGEKLCRIRVTNLSSTILRGYLDHDLRYLVFQDRVGVAIRTSFHPNSPFMHPPPRKPENEDDSRYKRYKTQTVPKELGNKEKNELVIKERFPFPAPRSVEHEYTKRKESTFNVGAELGGGTSGAQVSGKMDYQSTTGSSHVSRFRVGDFEILPDHADGWECFLMHIKQPKGDHVPYPRKTARTILDSMVKRRCLFHKEIQRPVQQAIGTFAYKEFSITRSAPLWENRTHYFQVYVYQQSRYITTSKGFATISNSIRVPIKVNLFNFKTDIGDPKQKIVWIDKNGKFLNGVTNPPVAPGAPYDYNTDGNEASRGLRRVSYTPLGAEQQR